MGQSAQPARNRWEEGTTVDCSAGGTTVLRASKARRTVAVLPLRPGANVRPAGQLGQILALGFALLQRPALVARRAVEVPRAASKGRRVVRVVYVSFADDRLGLGGWGVCVWTEPERASAPFLLPRVRRIVAGAPILALIIAAPACVSVSGASMRRGRWRAGWRVRKRGLRCEEEGVGVEE